MHKISDEETTPPLVSNNHNGAGNSSDTVDTNTADNGPSASPSGNLVDGLTPEPKRQHRNTVEDEQRAAQIKALNKKINGIVIYLVLFV